ncbi:MAG: hypothetical protein GY948_00420 [Alphaproteobacteria bacterium]|nr:hypothetical protein [Alphaproteobacteria bacterium]
MKLRAIPAKLVPVVGMGLLVLSVACGPAASQSGTGIGTNLTDASSKSKAAVDISADSMELLEEQKKAVFTGNVDAVRGKIKLKSNKLVVDYAEVKRKNGSKKTEVRFLNATGNVKIVSGNQTITSDRAKMNVKTNKAIISGNVTVVQGKTRLKGNKLHLNLTTGKSRMEGGRVRAKFFPQQ